VTGRLLRAVPIALAGVVLAAGTAFAHVEISPEQVAAGSFGTYTVQVPNEEADEDTVGLDLTLPAGFLLESAESVPGWRTTVDVRRDGTPFAVHWKGGRLRPHTFGQFAITGRVPKEPGTLRFPAVQHEPRPDRRLRSGAVHLEELRRELGAVPPAPPFDHPRPTRTAHRGRTLLRPLPVHVRAAITRV